MFERSELRSSREERNLNGVKNLLGAKTFPKISDITGNEMLPPSWKKLTLKGLYLIIFDLQEVQEWLIINQLYASGGEVFAEEPSTEKTSPSSALR
jgi:hypothetical protein